MTDRRSTDRPITLVTGPPAASAPVTVVVPTRNEAGNVRPLLDRFAALRPGVVGEVLFVDDSDDDTPQAVLASTQAYAFPVRLLHRNASERRSGLSGAVAAGIAHARCEWVCVIDGDLQHPPEVIPDLATALATGADVAVATRYRAGGDHTGLGALRTAVSRASTIGARALFPRALTGVSDPMSGFFLVRREVLDLSRLRPRGFKILLEILVRHPRLRRVEVPYRFEERAWGTTKASARQGVEYLRQLASLRWSTVAARRPAAGPLVGFATVGVVGLAVNQAVLVALVESGALGYLAAAVVAAQVAITTNFALCDRVVFRRARTGSVRGRFTRFWLASNSVSLLGLPALALLVSGLGVHYAAANVLVVGAQFLARFAVSARVVWRPRRARPAEVTLLQPRTAPHDAGGVGIDVPAAGAR